ncbi:hypothetical protein HCA63_17005 [Listeria booriae]|uniref:hypothetical protein n=1 Tax=Listeria booriae TaxID=1552123 RepID=UPI0016277FCB|nr:hypothetical protein [Listeria booriae]MBC1890058.1 hypothetical protein [Listeria booriae]
MKNAKGCLFYIYYKDGEHMVLEPENTDKLISDFLGNLRNQAVNDALIISATPEHLEFIFWTKIEAEKEYLLTQVTNFFLSFHDYAVEAGWGKEYENFLLAIASIEWIGGHIKKYDYT